MKRLLLLFLGVVLAGLVVVDAQERIDQDVFWKIRQEGTNNSRILQTVQVLTDVYGPRLTGSPNAKAAGEWAVAQMQAWGMKNGHLEPWDFNRPGWLNERLSAHIVSPIKDALVVEALAWTPGTNGVVRGAAMRMTLPQRPTKDELTSYLNGIKEAVKGRMVLVGPPQQVLVTFNAPALRRDDAEVVTQMNAPPAAAAQAPAGRPGGPGAQGQQAQDPQPLTAAQIQDQLNDFLVANGALVRINDAGRELGQIRAFNNRTYDPARSPATVVMRNEDYGRIWRLLAGGLAGSSGVVTAAALQRPQNVELEFDIVNRMYPEGRTSH